MRHSCSLKYAYTRTYTLTSPFVSGRKAALSRISLMLRLRILRGMCDQRFRTLCFVGEASLQFKIRTYPYIYALVTICITGSMGKKAALCRISLRLRLRILRGMCGQRFRTLCAVGEAQLQFKIRIFPYIYAYVTICITGSMDIGKYSTPFF